MSNGEHPQLRLLSGRTVPITLRGYQLMARPMLNRGTSFTYEERRRLGLVGLLPNGVSTMDSQVNRIYQQFQSQPDNLSKNVMLTALRDRNEVLFYRVIADHLEEMLPIVYTPTIGEAIEKYSDWYTQPRGVFLSIDRPEEIEASLANYGLDADQVDLVVATDSEGILGIGDQGVGGVAIATGKLSVYTAAAGIHPRRGIPVVLDVGTDNIGLLDNSLYLGERHPRVTGERYDEFIEKFVRAIEKLFPKAMLHWEDFGAGNAHRILVRYRDEICTFNDDIQGTAAVVFAAAVAGVRAADSQMRDQRVVVHGAGSAGIGIVELMRNVMVAEGLTEQEANARFWCLGSRGLITESLGDKVRSFQRPYARSDAEVAAWGLPEGERVDLADVVRHVKPTMLIGTSAQAGAFTEEIVRNMAEHTERPIIMPLSNPTPRAEARPVDLLEWTQGRVLVATGSPFAPVEYDGVRYEIAQANNALVFPGLGLGVSVCHARRISDGMIDAAARACADMVDPDAPGRRLLPSINALRSVSSAVALAVCRQAEEEGLSRVDLTDPVGQVSAAMWRPEYATIEFADSTSD